jgi:hypothetical protein
VAAAAAGHVPILQQQGAQLQAQAAPQHTLSAPGESAMQEDLTAQGLSALAPPQPPGTLCLCGAQGETVVFQAKLFVDAYRSWQPCCHRRAACGASAPRSLSTSWPATAAVPAAAHPVHGITP